MNAGLIRQTGRPCLAGSRALTISHMPSPGCWMIGLSPRARSSMFVRAQTFDHPTLGPGPTPCQPTAPWTETLALADPEYIAGMLGGAIGKAADDKD